MKGGLGRAGWFLLTCIAKDTARRGSACANSPAQWYATIVIAFSNKDYKKVVDIS